jgi:CRP-like cAMP-binding protein
MPDLKIINTFFNKLSDESKLLFLDLLTKKQYNKGDFVIKANDLSENFYFVTKGIVRSFIVDENGKEYTRSLCAPSSTVGSLSALINRKPSNYSFQCLTYCEIYTGNFYAYKKLAEKRMDFSEQYSTVMENIFLLMESRVYDLSVLNATERYLKLKKEIPDIENLIAQYHIASYLNITAVQLSRIRKKIIKEQIS